MDFFGHLWYPLTHVGILTLICLTSNFLQHWNFRPPYPLRYSDVLYGWPLIMFFHRISLNLDAQTFEKQVSFLFLKLDLLPKVTLWRSEDNKNTFWDFSIFTIQIWKMFGNVDGCGMTAPFRDKGFIQCYEVNSKIT